MYATLSVYSSLLDEEQPIQQVPNSGFRRSNPHMSHSFIQQMENSVQSNVQSKGLEQEQIKGQQSVKKDQPFDNVVQKLVQNQQINQQAHFYFTF